MSTTKTSWIDIANVALQKLNVTQIALTDVTPGSPIGVGSGTSVKTAVITIEQNIGFCVDEVTRKFRWPELLKRQLLVLKTAAVSVSWTGGTYGSYHYFFQLPSDFDTNGVWSISPSVVTTIQTVVTLGVKTYFLWCVTNPGGETFTYTPLNLTEKQYCYNLPTDFVDALDAIPALDDHTFVEILNNKNYITSGSYYLEGGLLYTDDPAPILLYLRRPNPLQAGGDTLRDNMWYLYALRLCSMISTVLTSSGSAATQEALAEYSAKVIEAGRLDQKRQRKPAEKVIWGEHSRRGFRAN